ncbi:MAG: AraC family transcriptional regulator [Pseudomonadota bacterium]
MSRIAPKLQSLMPRFATEALSGIADTDLPGLRYFWSRQSRPPTPVVYEPGIVIIGQGHKVGYLGERVFRYDPDTCLVVTVPMPFACETHGSEAAPLLGLFVSIDMSELTALCEAVRPEPGVPTPPGEALLSGAEPVPLSEAMLGAVERMLDALGSPQEARALGPGILREILYRALTGPHGDSLRALTRSESQLARLARAIQRMEREFTAPLSVPGLAEEAGLSVSAFHRRFKEVTSETPLQYLKKMRLNRARMLIVHNDMRPSVAAVSVGYESASQFSREFRRHFNVPPSEAKSLGP